ncbi:hypothetical protein VDR70_008240 [Xanthomonas campestris pv. campestris]|uniref:hypothetical protein n=1 Tax=Xanthomonas campestris TaxID=339 RepID=UPI002AD30C1F|nr:hypothetical protein [Xanthomonas campestris]MEA0940795.1 hypothetical protein [Xanthomonas campestris pv. campestris]MEA0961525.1 hypothetical protein [Xanthomonas campestris pv. campestris]MEB1882291.1 hypothetical protein [Xanthomonas campestris pv. campestris]MEB1927587.1 hypothetical protein [Xanthomonas campestris pv. campestris]
MSARDLADHAYDREDLDLRAWRQDDRRAVWTAAVELDVVDRDLKDLADRLITAICVDPPKNQSRSKRLI